MDKKLHLDSLKPYISVMKRPLQLVIAFIIKILANNLSLKWEYEIEQSYSYFTDKTSYYIDNSSYFTDKNSQLTLLNHYFMGLKECLQLLQLVYNSICDSVFSK